MYFKTLSISLIVSLHLSGMQKALSVGDLSKAETSFFKAADEGDVEGLETSVDSGVDVNTRNRKKQTALLLATLKGHTAAVTYLTKAGADCSLADVYGNTPLKWAATAGFIGCLSILCDYVEDINEQDELGYTVLLLAASSGNAFVTKRLIEKGAFVTAKNTKGETALHLATSGGFRNCVKTLMEKGANPNAQTLNDLMTPLHYAAQQGHASLIEPLAVEPSTKKGRAFMDAPTAQGQTSLHLVVSQESDEHLATTKELIKYKVPLNVQDRTVFRDTALHSAARLGHLKQAELLLQAGADSTVVNAQGNTAFNQLVMALLPEVQSSLSSQQETIEKALISAQEKKLDALTSLLKKELVGNAKKRKSFFSKTTVSKLIKK